MTALLFCHMAVVHIITADIIYKNVQGFTAQNKQ
jgi:hypothetical protein